MTYLRSKDHDNDNVASLIISADLRIAECNEAWRAANFPAANAVRRERIDKLNLSPELASRVLDILLSGEPQENVIIQLRSDGGSRYLHVNLYPESGGRKSQKVKKVVIQAWEMKPCLLLDRVTRKVIKVTDDAEEILGLPQSELDQEAAWKAASALTEEEFELALDAAGHKGSHYLGKCKHSRSDGSQIELESVLMRVITPDL